MLFEMVLFNSLLVALIGVGLCIWAAFTQKPGLIHFLWLALLIKMLTPPLYSVPVLPRMAIPSSDVPLLERVDSARVIETGVLPNTSNMESVFWSQSLLLIMIWVLGSLIVVLCFSIKAWRFSKNLSRARAPDPSLAWLIRRLSQEMGLSQAPRCVIVETACPPAIWSWFRPATLILPENLIRELRKVELEGVVLHELAHLKRRDHWIRPLEVLAISLLWWNPVFWWVKNRLRVVEEQCCDAWVNRMRPTQSRAYADALVKTLTFMSGRPHAPLAWSSGLGRLGFLERRLVAIMKKKHQVVKAGGWVRSLAVMGAILILAVYPTWGKNPNSWESEEPKEQNPLAERHKELVAEAEQLSRALQENEVNRQRLEIALQTAHEEKAIAELEAQSRQLAVEEKTEEAQRLASEADSRKKALAMQRERTEMQLERYAEMLRMQEEKRVFDERIQEALSSHDRETLDRARVLERTLELEHARREAEMQQHQLDLELDHLQREKEMQERENERKNFEEAQQEREHRMQLEMAERERAMEKAKMERARELVKGERERLEVERRLLAAEEARRDEEIESLRAKRKKIKEEQRTREQAMVRANLEDRIISLKEELERMENQVEGEPDPERKRAIERHIEELRIQLERMNHEMPRQ